MQMLYKKKNDKAEEFVDYMTKSDETKDKETASSPAESKDDGDLELKLDNEWVAVDHIYLLQVQSFYVFTDHLSLLIYHHDSHSLKTRYTV